MTSMNDPVEDTDLAALMSARAADWAAGASEAKAQDRRRVALMSVNERLAEGVELVRVAEELRASIRPRPV